MDLIEKCFKIIIKYQTDHGRNPEAIYMNKKTLDNLALQVTNDPFFFKIKNKQKKVSTVYGIPIRTRFKYKNNQIDAEEIK